MRDAKLDPKFQLEVDSDLIMKLPTAADAPLIFSEIELNREYLRTFLGWVDTTKTANDVAHFLAMRFRESLCQEALTLSIWHQGRFVGIVALQSIDPINRSTPIGYWLVEEKQHLGIMRKCVQRLIQYAFENLHLHRIKIECAVSNKPSRKLAESLGFKSEGVLKDAIWHYGEYFDAAIYALINQQD